MNYLRIVRNSICTWLHINIICMIFHLFALPPSVSLLLVSSAESVLEGMQSGQLLQADAPAAGEDTGELQPHHRTKAESCVWRG